MESTKRGTTTGSALHKKRGNNMSNSETFDAAEAFRIVNGDYPSLADVVSWTKEDLIKLEIAYDNNKEGTL
jgi:hypothetical protein